MPVSLETIFRAACSDAIALADIARNPDSDQDAVALLCVVVLIDSAPHPLAALAALAAHEHPPQALCAVARRTAPAAADLLEQDACSDLRAALVPHLHRVWNALAPPSDQVHIAASRRRTGKIDDDVIVGAVSGSRLYAGGAFTDAGGNLTVDRIALHPLARVYLPLVVR